jgi:two-component system, cell cycle sensor histidine kinase and response regulator CckA
MHMNLPLSDPFKNKLKDIESYIESGTSLTRQLMDFAKSKKPESIAFDIESLMDETAKMFSRTRKEIQLKTNYSGDAKIIEADPERIRQVIINLLINAWQAMPKGGELLIETATESLDIKKAGAFSVHPGDYFKICISDTGTGIEPSIIPKIFDPFFTTKKRGRGTGLGLATAYGIIKNHGGHISVDSQPGKGSTFHLYLPLSSKQAVDGDTNVLNDQILKGSEAILLVDDEADILEICKDLLEALGYTVFTAQNGDQAISIYLLHADRIHLVILDMMMPMMNGQEIYDRLIKINPDIKALLSSGYIQSDQAENLLKKGFNGFIQKPFNIQQLSNAVRKILN